MDDKVLKLREQINGYRNKVDKIEEKIESLTAQIQEECSHDYIVEYYNPGAYKYTKDRKCVICGLIEEYKFLPFEHLLGYNIYTEDLDEYMNYSIDMPLETTARPASKQKMDYGHE